MIGPLRRRLTLLLLGLRDLLASAGPVALLAAAVLLGAYGWLDPQPPGTLTLATGPEGSAYAAFGERYAGALAAHGIGVRPLATAGSLANLQALREGRADASFVRGGSADAAADGAAGIVSLGALFYEPIWVFQRAPAGAGVAPAARHHAAPTAPAPIALTQLKGLRVNVDPTGSGVPELLQRLLEANGLTMGDLRLSQLPPEAAAEALLGGRLDALVLVTAAEAPLVERLLRSPGIALLDVPQADAYARRFAFLQAVTLPRGVVDLAADIPPRDVALLATTTSLLTREQTHPALRQLLAQAAQGLHGGAGWLQRARDFPNTRTSELPVSPEGDRAINGQPPLWQRYLPFWASNLLERMWLVIGGLIVLLLPLSRVVPPLYTFRVRRRVFRWYARLRDIEARLDEGSGPRAALLHELDELERVAHRINVPLAHAAELYALRTHIDAVRRRARAAAQG